MSLDFHGSFRSLGSHLLTVAGRGTRLLMGALRALPDRLGTGLRGIPALWRKLPPDRRFSVGSVALLSLLLAGLILHDRPDAVRLSLPDLLAPYGVNGSPRGLAGDRGTGTAASAGASTPGGQAAKDRNPAPGGQVAAGPRPTPDEKPSGGRTEAPSAPASGSAPDSAPADSRPAAARRDPEVVDSAPPDAPISGRTLVAYGWAYFPGAREWRLHAGVDLEAARGDPVRAAASGVVAGVVRDPLLGLTVAVDHGGGRSTRYAGLDTAAVRPGDRVRRGQVIGRLGAPGPLERNQGPHLHFEVRQGDQPVDPATVMSGR